MTISYKQISILVFLLGILVSNFAFGQSINKVPFKLRHKIEDNKILLRVCPVNGQIWELGNAYGYTIEKSIINNDGTSKLLNTFEIKPEEHDKWNPHIDSSGYFMGARKLIYYDRVDFAEREADLPSSEYTESEKNEIRFNFATIAINSNFMVAKLAGLGFEEPYTNAEDNFRYQVTLNAQGKSYIQTIEIQPSQFTPPIPPTISAKGENKKVYIDWSTVDAKWDFHSYRFQLSDDSLNFYNKFEYPYQDHADTISHIDEKNIITLEDTLSMNYQPRWYRIKGVDYFGDESIASPVVRGQGIDVIQISPYFTDGIQTDSNYAVLKWEVQPEDAHLIDYFILSHGDSIKAEFKNITNLPADARTYTSKMEFANNFFILTTIPKDGIAIHSYPISVMAYDATPPHKPVGLEGVVDTNGIVKLIWNNNTDQDLKGYEVFKRDFDSSEFYQLSTHPVLDTLFADTLSLKLAIEDVQYAIAAIDRRHNQSIFSDTLKLKRPDINPPVEPHIFKLDNRKDSIVLQWFNSSSEDAVLHQLFRKAIPSEKEWTLLASYPIEDSTTVYIDIDVKPKVKYAYILTATDDDGLTSPPSEPVVTKSVSYGNRPEILNFIGNQEGTENKVNISWEYDHPEVFSYWLYKKKEGGRLSLYKKLGTETNTFTDQKVSNKNRYEYYLKAYFRDGTNSPFSEKLIIELKSE